MTGDLMVKQKQFSTAELKVKQLATQDVSLHGVVPSITKDL